MKEFDNFVDLVYSLENKDVLADFLIGITTPKERQELVRRVEIVHRLLAGQPQAKIASDLGVGVATVTRGSKELAAGRFHALKEEL